MRILSGGSEQVQTIEKKPAKKIAGTTTDGRRIVRRNAPSQSMSTGEIRDLIVKMKNKKQVKKPMENANRVSSSMPDVKEIKEERAAEAKAKLDAISDKSKVGAELKSEVKVELKEQEKAEIKAKLKTEDKTEVKTEVKAEEKKLVDSTGAPILSDVQKNDPTDTNVQEKLRAILRTGAFEFNQKEKGALSAILGAS